METGGRVQGVTGVSYDNSAILKPKPIYKAKETHKKPIKIRKGTKAKYIGILKN